jgi:hypothetical protein
VDLFDPRHARKVLVAFGRAFGALPEHSSEISSDQDSFLDQSISGLAQDGKIVSVRLALFAEMFKGKQWAPATLKAVGNAAALFEKSRLRDRLDSIIAHEYEEHRHGMSHNAALKTAPRTGLPITERAREICRAMERGWKETSAAPATGLDVNVLTFSCALILAGMVAWHPPGGIVPSLGQTARPGCFRPCR